MNGLKIGDIVARKSYGGDVFFTIEKVLDSRDDSKKYVLRGLHQRLLADSHPDDLIKKDSREVMYKIQRSTAFLKRQAHLRNFPSKFLSLRYNSRPGTILHIDSSGDFMQRCISQYKESGIKCYGVQADESEQPYRVARLLEQYRPDILVVTGHDALKKDSANIHSIDNYWHSKYFIQSVTEARKYEADKNKLCIFAGACQSYYEAIMNAGANFASSPGRILINALDPAMVAEKVALTDYRKVVTQYDVARITVSGSKGIGGITTKGRLTWV
ncbi:MAG: sporulation peptidase YabG [Bacillota bacterium]|nr:sporulation peptidase YabG [Bacillota bacterium]